MKVFVIETDETHLVTENVANQHYLSILFSQSVANRENPFLPCKLESSMTT